MFYIIFGKFCIECGSEQMDTIKHCVEPNQIDNLLFK